MTYEENSRMKDHFKRVCSVLLQVVMLACTNASWETGEFLKANTGDPNPPIISEYVKPGWVDGLELKLFEVRSGTPETEVYRILGGGRWWKNWERTFDEDWKKVTYRYPLRELNETLLKQRRRYDLVIVWVISGGPENPQFLFESGRLVRAPSGAF